MKKVFFLGVAVALFAAGCGSNSNNNAPAALSAPNPTNIEGACKKISLQDAREMVKYYHEDSAQLKLSNGDSLVSWFVDRNALEDLLSNRENDGIRIYLAKNTTSNDYTICIIGTKPDSLNPTIHNNAPGSIYDFSQKCPTMCNQNSTLELYQR